MIRQNGNSAAVCWLTFWQQTSFKQYKTPELSDNKAWAHRKSIDDEIFDSVATAIQMKHVEWHTPVEIESCRSVIVEFSLRLQVNSVGFVFSSYHVCWCIVASRCERVLSGNGDVKILHLIQSVYWLRQLGYELLLARLHSVYRLQFEKRYVSQSSEIIGELNQQQTRRSETVTLTSLPSGLKLCQVHLLCWREKYCGSAILWRVSGWV